MAIMVSSILLFVVLIILFSIEIFIFWGIFGEGATASRIAEIWYVKLILDYLPFATIIGYLGLKTFANYKSKKYIEYKTNIITLITLILIFSFRSKILN
ncbi:hypothetical protein KBJ98_08095 [Flavobacterium sp. F-328]|uniref:DUF5658 domain-containing protein n=1 Tax=Flavobacterium erciyesense TaxID=2825842 RepID=A0ABS5D3Q1_9FLAO|nr:hypothetical protein [Flavobacterium erciyesense]MBQ0908659.1 hypothetical protein [Flavobacterium erciyesense]